MSFLFLEKPIFALKMAPGEFVLPSVLPHDIDALKTLSLAQQNALSAAVQSKHQSMHRALHQEAASNQCTCCAVISITEVSSRGQTLRGFSRRICSSQNLLRLQPRTLMRFLSAVAKDKGGVGKRIEPELVFDDGRQTIDVLAKVNFPAVQLHRQDGVQTKHGDAARALSTLERTLARL